MYARFTVWLWGKHSDQIITILAAFHYAYTKYCALFSTLTFLGRYLLHRTRSSQAREQRKEPTRPIEDRRDRRQIWLVFERRCVHCIKSVLRCLREERETPALATKWWMSCTITVARRAAHVVSSTNGVTAYIGTAATGCIWRFSRGK